jgi:transcriptional regulator with XRE-family HTH domain
MSRARRNLRRLPSAEFGAHLKVWRKKRNLKQCEAATLLGIKASHLCQIENGKRPAPDAILGKIADVYDVAVEEVVRRAHWPQLTLLDALVEPCHTPKEVLSDLADGLLPGELQEAISFIVFLRLRRSISSGRQAQLPE